MSEIAGVKVETETFTCQNCGGVISFDVKSQKFSCSSCKAVYDLKTLSDSVKEYDFNQYNEMEQSVTPFEGAAVAVCKNCGLEVTLDEKQVAVTCPMCGGAQLAECKQRSGIPPEAVVPFQIDRHEAQKRFRAWVKSRWFAPNDFKKKYGEGALSGMYLPFWTYDASAFSNYTGEGGKNRTVKDSGGKEKTVTDWFPVSGVITSVFDDVLVCASEKEKNIRTILPYNTVKNAKPYAAGYLSGYYAEVYKIKADKAFESAKITMNNKMSELACDKVLQQYDTCRNIRVNTKYTNVTYKHILLPLWSSAFGYKGKTYGYLVNGETGKVGGQRPWSAAKICAAIILALTLIITAAIIFNLGGETPEDYTDMLKGGYAYGMVWTGQGYY